jgi:hypothetical protein
LRVELPQLPLHAHVNEQVHEAVARVVPHLGEPCDMVRPTPVGINVSFRLRSGGTIRPGPHRSARLRDLER